MFIQYGFMPNHLGYCGGNENQLLLEHAVAGDADPALGSLLAKFTGAYPYLRTIAQANGVANPFDATVVEAYWIGNPLLDRVGASALSRSIEERFGKQLTPRMREQIMAKPVQGARPFHLFHVIDVYRHLESKEISMAAMENCRISWGKVKTVQGSELLVDRRPLVTEGAKLKLGEPRAEKVLRSVDGKGFVDDVQPGDVVSIHWGWACDVLDRGQLANLKHYTKQHLDLANQTL